MTDKPTTSTGNTANVFIRRPPALAETQGIAACFAIEQLWQGMLHDKIPALGQTAIAALLYTKEKLHEGEAAHREDAGDAKFMRASGILNTVTIAPLAGLKFRSLAMERGFFTAANLLP